MVLTLRLDTRELLFQTQENYWPELFSPSAYSAIVSWGELKQDRQPDSKVGD